MIVQDRSQSNFLKDESHIQKPVDVIIQENRRYIPFFIGGHCGYYTDLQPTPAYDAVEIVLEFLCLLALVLKWVFYGQLYVDVFVSIKISWLMQCHYYLIQKVKLQHLEKN